MGSGKEWKMMSATVSTNQMSSEHFKSAWNGGCDSLFFSI